MLLLLHNILFLNITAFRGKIMKEGCQIFFTFMLSQQVFPPVAFYVLVFLLFSILTFLLNIYKRFQDDVHEHAVCICVCTYTHKV